MVKPKKERTLDDVVESIEKLADSIQKILLVHPKSVQSPVEEVKSVELPELVKEVRQESKFPVPYEFEELKNTLLNKNFSLEIEYLPDQAAMSFSILVPKKYSNAGENHWITYKEDRRSKVISNALGANGVRQWCEQVYNNFNESTKSAITYDRAQL